MDMDIVKLKQIVSRTEFTKMLAEPVLNIYVSLRYLFSGSFTEEKEDRAALDLLKSRFGLTYKDVQYLDIGASHYLRGNNTYLCYKWGGAVRL